MLEVSNPVSMLEVSVLHGVKRNKCTGRKPAWEPSLYNMTLKAVDLLEDNNKEGYFMLVEGAKIDMGQHLVEPYLTLTEGEDGIELFFIITAVMKLIS